MYHIFFSFFLIASQKQINQTQKYFEQQKKHSNKITQTTKENPKQDISDAIIAGYETWFK